jgi:hypothetical protein
MVALLLVALVLLLLFSGLGLFVAKAFFIGIIAALAVALLAGVFTGRSTA